MKKALLILTGILFTASAVFAAEPLLLEPLTPEVLQGTSFVTTDTNGVQTTNADGTYEASYTKPDYGNMVPQNDAAEGKPVRKKRTPRVRIQTKQGRQTNTQWNPGGKGTKSFF